MNFHRLSVLAALITLIHAAPSRADETPSKISAVTVYSDRALVTRTAKVKLAAGEQSVIFEKLPAGLFEDSVSAAVHNGFVKILGIELQRKFLGESPDEKIRSLQKEIEQLNDQRRQLNDRIQVDRKQLEFADKLQIYQIDKVSKEFAIKETKVEEWDSVLKFLEKTRTERMESIVKKEIQLRELDRQLNVKQSELNPLYSVRPTETRTVVVNLDVKQAGDATVEIRYVIGGASWRPMYDARADTDSKDVELTYYGTINQRTGEEWKDVEVALSTARPNVGAHLAELQPVYLTPGSVMTMLRPTLNVSGVLTNLGMLINSGSLQITGAGNFMNNGPAPASGTIPDDSDSRAWVTASVETHGTSALYKVPKLQTITSGERPQRVTVSVDKFKSDLIYVTRPKIQPFCYLKALTRNTTDNQLVPGHVNIFLRGDFIGQSWIDVVAPRQEFPIYLGIDERMKVKREPLVDKTRETAWGKKLVLSLGFRTTIENYTGVPQTVFLYDQMPVSKDASIEVRNFKAEVKPTQIKEEKGEIQWRLEMKHGEKRVIEFGYEVVFPEEIVARPEGREAIKRLQGSF